MVKCLVFFLTNYSVSWLKMFHILTKIHINSLKKTCFRNNKEIIKGFELGKPLNTHCNDCKRLTWKWINNKIGHGAIHFWQARLLPHSFYKTWDIQTSRNLIWKTNFSEKGSFLKLNLLSCKILSYEAEWKLPHSSSVNAKSWCDFLSFKSHLNVWSKAAN